MVPSSQWASEDLAGPFMNNGDANEDGGTLREWVNERVGLFGPFTNTLELFFFFFDTVVGGHPPQNLCTEDGWLVYFRKKQFYMFRYRSKI